MNHSEFQLRGVGDPRLAVHATSALPAWLWSTDGTRILWANQVGARLFGAANGATLAERLFGPADAHRRQVAQLASRLPSNGAVRLERLRGFGAAYGRLVTCGCARLDFADGSHGILIAAAEPVGRPMPLVERLQRLVEGVDSPIAAFGRDGMLIGASDAARSLLGFHNLGEAGLGQARSDALKQGRVELPVGIGHLVLQRVGSGADVGLVALIAIGTPPIQPPIAEPAPSNGALAGFTLVDEFAEPLTKTAEATETAEAAPADPVSPPAPDYEAPANSGEAPAEFAQVDEFSSQPEQPIAETPLQAPEPASEADHDEPGPRDESAHHDEPAREAPSELLQELLLQEPFLPEPSPQEPSPQEPSPQEPSPYVEAVADEPSPEAAAVDAEAATPNHDEVAAAAPVAPPIETPPWHNEPAPPPRGAPLRFIWQMDADGRFSLGSDEFTHLIGSHTAAGFGRLWRGIAETFGLDPEGRVLKAVATRHTWSGITLNWPVDGGARLPVELSGLPLYDRARNFAGYRGFGVCRDLDGLARLAALRRYELFNVPPPVPQALSAGVIPAEPPAGLPANVPVNLASEAGLPDAGPAPSTEPELSVPIASETSHQTDLATHDLENQELENQVDPKVETPKNVLPFRPIGDTKSPVLTPVENNAFNELARQLAERLERQGSTSIEPPPQDAASETPEAVVAQPAAEETEQTVEEPAQQPAETPLQEKASPQPGWLAHPEPPARGESRRDKALLDLLPVGVLIYRLDRLLYANAAFLQRMGYHSLHALEEAGGLDALYVEPGVSSASSTSDTGTPVTISGSQSSGQDGAGQNGPPSASEAHLYTIAWDDEQALALIFAAQPAQGATIAAALAEPVMAEPVFVEPVLAEPARTSEPSTSEATTSEPSPVGHANAEELAAILDTTAEGILMFDAEGNINSCNRSAEALFGHDGADLVQRNLADLFAPESAPAVRDYLESVKGADISSLLEQGRDLLARVDGSGLIPVSMTMGRTQAHGPNFFAVFRDLSQAKKSESELREARRLADRAANAKSDMLARISHEVRTPLNAIIGFAEVMIGERFGALGNERYVEYMKDIRASGERVIAIINDLLDLSRIETGKLDLAFANQNLNDLVEQCVAVMQPQANRERIIIRTSLAHMLPHVVADARALRQITLNLIGNSIHLANAGGQVIVSTALSDFGEVVLRVRDTGHGLNDNEVAAAMEPFRTTAPSDQASDSSGVSLSLTKALVEANRAQFQIKTGGRSGTLIEVLFPHAMARA
jgi:PAS domain S-box-containing protein